MPVRRLVALVALVGFLASAIVSSSVAVGLAMPYREVLRFLMFALLAVWLLTVNDLRRFTKGFVGVWYWRYALQGGPKWFAKALLFLYVYFGLCCVLRIAYLAWHTPSLRGVGSLFFLGASALMVAYGIAAMAEYSAVRRSGAQP